MAITAAMVKELRERTGAGMMDCKKALAETDGDMKAAIDYLREKGIAKAEKKAGRIAAEGAVTAYLSADAKAGAIVEINSETNPVDLDALNASTLDGKEVAALITEATATIGEKISLRRFARYEGAGRVATYIHMGGKIGVLVELSGGDEQLGKDIAMQIAAAAPIAVDRSGVTADDIEHEKEVLRKQALEEGKPEKIVEKMVEGRINKFYEEVCLLEQKFVKDPEQKVSAVLGSVGVKRFTRFQLGEGIEKKQEDFAAEVAAQMQ